MSEMIETNGHPPKTEKLENPTPGADETVTAVATAEPTQKRPKKKGPNYGLIHRNPLPLATHPLPAFHPTNPISLLRLAYTYIVHLLAPPSSHPAQKYVGYFSPESRSVHITDPLHVRALWEMGFFGKGTLSRSEPSWLEREKARLKAKRAGGGGTAEEATNARRERRRLEKFERARAEAEKIARQRLIEEGKLDPTLLEVSDTSTAPETTTELATPEPTLPPTEQADAKPISNEVEGEDHEEPQIENQEFLQLTLEEAFFLSYALGVLDIRSTNNDNPTHLPKAMISTFSRHSYFPPLPAPHPPAPDDPFLLHYAAYHHFRSRGWVVRPGVKFAVDYLLYYRGPVFSHAEFAVLIVPAYTDAYWASAEGRTRRRAQEDARRDWWWLHCVNRVQSQVLKSLVLAYVDVPAPGSVEGEWEVGELLKGYRIREFVVKRWVANRSRD